MPAVVEQRNEMLGGGPLPRAKVGVCSCSFTIDQGSLVISGPATAASSNRWSVGAFRGPVPVDEPQIVNDIAACKNEDFPARAAARAWRRARDDSRTAARIDRQLDDGDVGVGIDNGKDAPSTMIEAPLILVEPDPGWADPPSTTSCATLRRPGSGIIEVEQGFRKAEEVMDGSWPCHGGDRGRFDEPVRRYDKDRAGPGNLSCPSVRQARVKPLSSSVFIGLP